MTLTPPAFLFHAVCPGADRQGKCSQWRKLNLSLSVCGGPGHLGHFDRNRGGHSFINPNSLKY